MTLAVPVSGKAFHLLSGLDFAGPLGWLIFGSDGRVALLKTGCGLASRSGSSSYADLL